MAQAEHTETGAVVLLSGGLDSSVLLHYVIRNQGRNQGTRNQGTCSKRRPRRDYVSPDFDFVCALSFDYGQRHARELECARWQAQAAGVAEHRVADMRFMGDLLRAGSTLIAGGEEVPNLDALNDEQLHQPPTYVPNRNMMLLAIAAAYAEAQGAGSVFYGAQAHDEYGYWDCTEAFLERINAVLALNRATPVTVHAPFVALKKADVVAMGQELGVNFAHTWSCYRGLDNACGTCPTCVERRNAFDSAGVEDPLLSG